MFKAGGFIRTSMKDNIRTQRSKKQKPAEKGKPPFSRTKILRKNIRFHVQRQPPRSVIIGPVRINTSSRKTLTLLEKGGTGTIKMFNHRTKKKEQKRFKMNPHPFAQPAYEKNEKQVRAWKDQL